MEVLDQVYWCHSCRNEFTTSPIQFACPDCTSEFIEKIESNEPHPRSLTSNTPSRRNNQGNRVIVQVVSRGAHNYPFLGRRQGLQHLLPSGLDLPLLNEIGGLPNFENLFANLLQIPENQGAPPAEQSEIDAIETVAAESIVGEKNCPICQEDISVIAKRLPCGHVYHENCIQQWLRMHNTCPSCRKSINES